MRQRFLLPLATLFVLISSLALTRAQPLAVRINEVLTDNTRVTNIFGGLTDMVELYNAGFEEADLSGCSLTDSNLFPQRYVFPPGVIIQSGEYLVIAFNSAYTNSPYTDVPGQAVPFGLKSKGGFVHFYDFEQVLIDEVEYGLQLQDHSIVRMGFHPTNWSLGTPSLGGPNTSLQLGNAFALRINEWLANPSSGNDDYFELYNRTNKPVALGKLYLTDASTNPLQYAIAPLSFIGTGALAYVTFEADCQGGTTGSPNRYPADKVNFSLKSEGESIIIINALFQIIHRVDFGSQVSGLSEGCLPDGNTNHIVRFPRINDYETQSLGGPNFLLLTNVFVNEILTHSAPPQEDVVEFMNRTGTNISIGGWWLSNERGTPQKYLIPPGTFVPANGYRTIYEGTGTAVGFNSSSAAIPFGFDSVHGDNIVLSQTDINGNLTGYQVYETFGAAANGVSFGHHQTSVPNDYKLVAMTQTTFGVDEPNSVSEFRSGTGSTNTYPKLGPLVINEIMYAPSNSIYYFFTNGLNVPTYDQNPNDEFIELRNVTSATVPLYDPAYPTNHWKLQNAVSYVFPLTNLAPNSFCLVVGFDPWTNAAALATFRNRYRTFVSNNVPIFGPWTGRLADCGAVVELCRPDSVQLPPEPDAGYVPFVCVDKVSYGASYPDGLRRWLIPLGGASLQRRDSLLFGNDPVHWDVATRTAGTPASSALLDSDADGIPDAWEIQYGFNPTNSADAVLDVDHDTTSNLGEYAAGTNPTNAFSVLRVFEVTPSPGYYEPAYVHFFAYSNATYTVEYRKDVDSKWKKLADVPARPFHRMVTEADYGVANQWNPVKDRYYRVVAPAAN